MVYSDTDENQGLVQLVRDLSKADANTLPEKAIRRFLNIALDKFYMLALFSSGTWSFDDTEYDDYPIGTADISNGQYEYEFHHSILTVRRVEIKKDGEWHTLRQVNENRLGRNLSEMHATTGMPTFYYIKGSSIFFDVTPNFSTTDGLKVYYERNVKKFDGSDDQRPGIPSPFHPWLAFQASYLYAVKEGRDNRNELKNEVIEGEEDIKSFFNRRNRALRPRMTVRSTPSK